MKNEWTEQYDRVCRELKDAQSTISAQADNIAQKGKFIADLICENAEQDEEIRKLKHRLGYL